METSNLEKKQKELAIKSFQASHRLASEKFREKVDSFNEIEKSYFQTRQECYDTLNEVTMLSQLIKSFGGEVLEEVGDFKPKEIVFNTYHSENQEINGVKDEEEDIFDTYTKRRRGIQKRVLELFVESGTLMSTSDVVQKIKHEFGDDTKYSSITNSLMRLTDSQQLKRDPFLPPSTYGLAEWFDEDGSPKKEYMNLKEEQKTKLKIFEDDDDFG